MSSTGDGRNDDDSSRKLPRILSWGYNKSCQLGRGEDANSTADDDDGGGSGGGGNGRGNQRVSESFIRRVGPVVAAGENPPKPFEIYLPTDDSGCTAGQTVAAGWVHCLVVDRDGACFGWGGNNNGTVGGALVISGQGRDGHGAPDETEPPPLNSVVRSPIRIPFPSGVQVRSVACGMFHSLAVDRDAGRVYSWGSGKFGKLGHGDLEPRFVPTLIRSFSDYEIVASRITAVRLDMRVLV